MTEYSRAARRSDARPRNATTTSRTTTATTTARYHQAPMLMKPRLMPRRAASVALGAGRGAMRPATRLTKRHVGSPPFDGGSPPSLLAPDSPPPNARLPTSHPPISTPTSRTAARSAARRSAEKSTHATARPPTIIAPNNQPMPCTSLSASSTMVASTRSKLRRWSSHSLANAADEEDERVPARFGPVRRELPDVGGPDEQHDERHRRRRTGGTERAGEQVRAGTDGDQGDDPNCLRRGHRLGSADREEQRGARGEGRVVVEERQVRGPLGRRRRHAVRVDDGPGEVEVVPGRRSVEAVGPPRHQGEERQRDGDRGDEHDGELDQDRLAPQRPQPGPAGTDDDDE